MTNSKMRDALENLSGIELSMFPSADDMAIAVREIASEALSCTHPVAVVSDEILRRVLAEEWGKSFTRPDVSHPNLLNRIRAGDISEVPFNVVLSAMRRISTLQDQDGVIEKCAQIADESRIVGVPEDGSYSDGQDTTADLIGSRIRLLKSPTPNGETP